MKLPIGNSLIDRLKTPKGALLAIPALLALAGMLLVAQKGGERTATAPSTAVAAVPSAGSAAVAPTPSTPSASSSAPAAAVVGTAPAATPSAASANFSATQKTEIEAVIRNYLLTNPEVMVEVQQALEARMEKVTAERMQKAISENANALFRSPTAPVAGNPKGDVTVVEFFDYNCGFCKRALGDLTTVIEKDSNVRVVLKEFPILSKGSEEAAKVALAARLQNKYWEFHRAMLELPGQANEAVALKVAEKAGLDMARLKNDMNGAEVKKEIDDTRALAQKLGIQGTPHFLVGDRVVPGAPDGLSDVLAGHINELRKAGGCKVCGG